MFVASERYKLPISLAVLFFAVGGITIAYTFVDLLFLSTYPASFLPYLFLGKTLMLLVFTFLVGQLIAMGSRWINATMLGIAAGTILISRWVLDASLTGFPFALALWLDLVGVLVGVIAFSAVNEVFDLRQMKSFGQWIYAMGGVGGLVFGLSVPWLITNLDANELLYIIAFAFALTAVGLASLQPLPVSVRESSQSARPMQYPLFVRTALAFILLLVIDTFADFVLKREVALAYDRDAIGAFMGPFYGLTNVITVVLQTTAVGLVLKKSGLAGLLLAVPLFGIVAAICIFFVPGLWIAAAFRMGETILRRGFDDFGRSLAINPLPSQIRRSARLLWNGVSAPIGTGIAAALLFLLADNAALHGLAIVTFLVASLWLLLISSIMKSYRQTLQEAVRAGRFTFDDGSLEDNPELLEELVHRSLTSDVVEEVRFGFELLSQHQMVLPAAVTFHLGAEARSLRADAVNAIAQKGDANSSTALLARLEIEEVPEIRFLLFETLASINSASAQALAIELLDSPLPEDRAGSVLLLFHGRDLEQIKNGTDVLARMVGTNEARVRRCAARVLGSFETGQAQAELRTLLTDSNPEVQTAALHAVIKRMEVDLIDDVARLLGHSGVSFLAGSTLSGFGEPAIMVLQRAALSSDNRVVKAALQALARINDPNTERALMELEQQGNVFNRTIIAAESAKFARRFGAGTAFKDFATEKVLQSADEIRALNSAAQMEETDENRTEIEARAMLAKSRLLAWFAAATEPATVFDLTPLILPARPDAVLPTDRSMALELMETLAAGPALKRAITVLDAASATTESPVELNDEWLSWFSAQQTNTTQGDVMNLTQIVMLLRKCPLFRDMQGEALLAIAEVSEIREVSRGERLFGKGDYPDGLYVIVSGFINMMNGEEVIEMYKNSDVLGEFELLDDSPRLADAVAATDGTVLYINKQTFEGVAQDIPEVLRSLTRRVVESLRTSLSQETGDQALPLMHPVAVDTPEKADTDELAETTLNYSSRVVDEAGFTTIEQGASVLLKAQHGEGCKILLAGHLFTLQLGEPPLFIDPDGVEFKLSRGENMIGRDSRCDIVVNSKMSDISRQHLVIDQTKNGELKITSISSAGTRIFTERIM